MARTAWPTVLSGDSWTASQHNTYGRDNDAAYWVFTTAGDLAYATSSSALARLALVTGGVMYGGASAPAWLAKPSARSVLINDSGGTPSWSLFAGDIHATSFGDYDAAAQDVTSTSYVDITNATLNITITKTCTILMIASGRMGADVSAKNAYAKAVLDGSSTGTEAGTALVSSTGVGLFPFTVMNKKTGVAAGTITAKIQGKIQAGASHGYYGAGSIMLVAIGE